MDYNKMCGEINMVCQQNNPKDPHQMLKQEPLNRQQQKMLGIESKVGHSFPIQIEQSMHHSQIYP